MKRGQQQTADKTMNRTRGRGQPTLSGGRYVCAQMWHVCVCSSLQVITCQHSRQQRHVHATAATSKALSAGAVRHFAETRRDPMHWNAWGFCLSAVSFLCVCAD